MKRSLPLTPEAEAGVPTRRRRALSAEERALWEAVAKSAKPLKARHRVTKVLAAEAGETKTSTGKPAVPVTPQIEVVPVKPVRAEPPQLHPLGRRERSQLARGTKDIEARLDLHGMTQARAHRTLLNFLQRASDDGLSFVLVITGKGRAFGEGSERGVLRRQVPEWLGLPEFRTCVVGFEEAHIGHGGGGALYVRVRRRRF
jgi:DNA-nicking Smr family endonuclease